MELIGIALIIIILVIYKKSKRKKTFFEELTKAYPNYTILKKIDMYLICDCKNHRKEPEELVFIRFNPKRKKIIYKRNKSITAVYPQIPKIRELKRDLKKYI